MRRLPSRLRIIDFSTKEQCMSNRMFRRLGYLGLFCISLAIPTTGLGQATPGIPDNVQVPGLPPLIDGPPLEFQPTRGDDLETDPADPPQQVAGAFRLKGAIIRGEDLSQVLTSLLLDPRLGSRLAAVPMGAGVVPLDLQDEAFEKYVSLQLLGDAWTNLNAERMADVAMQLAEGERILLRSHKAISAADALQLAAKTALDLDDKVTLDRLQKIAQVRNDKSLTAFLASAATLASAARGEEGDDDEIRIVAENTGPAQYALLHACCRDLKRAKLIGDGKMLQVLEHSIPHFPLITQEQKAQLIKAAKQPTPELDVKAVQLHKTMHLLAGAGRCEYGECTDGQNGMLPNGRYSAAAEYLEDLDKAYRLQPEKSAPVSSARDKLRAK
jgi:hypothetical protein